MLSRVFDLRGGTARDQHAGALATPPETPHRPPARRAAGLLIGTIVAGATMLTACGHSSSGKPVRRAKQRVFVLGFDGMDPTLARKWMDEGKLPNLKRLSEQGTFAKLETT